MWVLHTEFYRNQSDDMMSCSVLTEEQINVTILNCVSF
jgi:hypothetical protein